MMQLITACTSMEYAQYYSPKLYKQYFQLIRQMEEDKHPYCNQMCLHV